MRNAASRIDTFPALPLHTGMEFMQASCVAIGYKGVLLSGPSGCGKSDLALRLIDAGGRLVADDLVGLAAEKEVLIARPAGDDTYHGVLEIRGVGLLHVPAAPQATVELVVMPSDNPERLPEICTISLAGIELPLLHLPYFEASCPAKIRAALTYRRAA